MGALPKRKLSRRRRDNRRQHLRLRLPTLVLCSQCRELVPAHQACPHCGTYRGREILRVD